MAAALRIAASCARVAGEQALALWVLDVDTKRTVAKEAVALSPGATLQWLGFSDAGQVCRAGAGGGAGGTAAGQSRRAGHGPH